MNRQQRRALRKQDPITHHPDQPWWLQGVAHHQRGELPQAEQCYGKIAASHPLYYVVLGNWGALALQQSQLTKAMTLLQRALAIKPNFVDALINLAIVFKEMSRLLEAETCCRKVLAIQPTELRAQGNLGVILKNLGRLDAAEDCFRTVLATRPDHVESLNNLGNLLKDLGRLEEAALYYRQALTIHPNHVEILSNLGMTYLSLAQLNEAVTTLRRAIALSPDHVEALNHLGITYKELGCFTEAETYYRRVLVLSPRQADAHHNLGNVLKELGRLEESVACYQQAIQIKPDWAMARKHLGDVLRTLNRTDEAIKCYRQALALDPQDSLGLSFALAALGCAALPSRASQDQLERIYAKRARYWDHIADDRYRGADLVAKALKSQLSSPVATMLDAGCGTGMVGVLLRDLTTRLDGIDLSVDMLDKAREKGIYDALHQGDLETFMTEHPATYDAIVCAATLIHFGDLTSVFSACAKALRVGGYFVFTVFLHEADPEGSAVVVNPLEGFERGGCYAHGKGHVTQAALAAGLAVMQLQTELHEYVHDKAVHALVGVLCRGTDL
ncbi:MAG: tetratricopeptide repeat protein [Magnetococcales bacterium]|nr:tetratricopeptide repeat protein [Magnetococcales bacterium]